MLKKNEVRHKANKPALKKIKSKKEITEYVLTSNGLKVLYVQKPDTGVITSNIVYGVGSRDEARGETGIAHMLEHMLFKPTKFDVQRGTESGAMLFERETGVVLNASTWKDRTNYFFSYPREHFHRALRIEAERMHDVVLTDKEFLPERGNVLSEHDMYMGNEDFVLSRELHTAAFQLHTYGHETIGFRKDIENYTVEKLNAFYKKFYTPNNATLIVVGDVSEKEMKEGVLKYFEKLKVTAPDLQRQTFIEPQQEGERRITVKKPSTKQIIAFGIRHDALPTKDWFLTLTALNLLAGDSDSLLQKELVDTGLASVINFWIEPTMDENIAELFITLSGKLSHEKVEKRIHVLISALKTKTLLPYLKRTVNQVVLEEAISRESSLGYSSSLQEYVSAGVWESFFDSKEIIEKLTAREILTKIQDMFNPDKLTIGYFKGTN